MPKITLKSARTAHADPNAAAEELVSRLGELGAGAPKLVTLFASSDRDQRAVNQAVRARLPASTRLIGASAGGEIDNAGMHQGSVVLGALDGDFDVGIGLGKGLSADAISAGGEAVSRACAELGTRPADLDPRKNVGLVIDDGAKMKKEELLIGVLEKNHALVVVGGGASDTEIDPAKQKTFIHVDGEVVNDAALVALFSTEAPWAAFRSHWYEPSGQTLTITKVDPTHSRALEIDGKPAVQRYAEIVGAEVTELDFPNLKGFCGRPTALRVGREYFMRTPMYTLPDGSIHFANLLEEGTELEIMRIGDMGVHSRSFFETEVPKRVPSPTAALLFNCGARTWLALAHGQIGALSGAFALAPPAVGFNVGFEIYCGFQINTTLAALVFGENP
ncbi:MAG: FIST N-terminal domain-containing protein [Byssovorax sp.]